MHRQARPGRPQGALTLLGLRERVQGREELRWAVISGSEAQTAQSPALRGRVLGPGPGRWCVCVSVVMVGL